MRNVVLVAEQELQSVRSRFERNLRLGLAGTEVEVTLKPGPHTLQLLFGDKDHIPHNPPLLSAPIRVVVVAPADTAPPVRKKRRRGR